MARAIECQIYGVEMRGEGASRDAELFVPGADRDSFIGAHILVGGRPLPHHGRGVRAVPGGALLTLLDVPGTLSTGDAVTVELRG